MEECGSRNPSAGGLHFFGFRVKVSGGDAQVAAVASSPIKFPGFSFISMVTLRSLWEWCGLQGLLLAVGIFGSSRSFIGGSSLFFVFGTDVAF
jgi:hypothetical protein